MRWVIGIILFLFVSCNDEKKSETTLASPKEATMLTSVHRSDFALTLEDPVNNAKNSIYAPTILYAWDEILKAIGPVKLDSTNSDQLWRLEKSVSFLKSFEQDEYSKEVMTDSVGFRVRTFFNKTLPFATKMQKLQEGLAFDTVKVEAFGMQYYDNGIADEAEILYYKDDEHFVLRLIPRDTTSEIILAKGIRPPTSLARGLKEANEMIGLGKKKRSNPKQQWKYSISDGDIFQIPAIEFNLEKEFTELMGQAFKGRTRRNYLEYVYQRTSLVLNEEGAVIESEAVMSVDSASTEMVQPKQMIFNKPFLMIVKKRNRPNPYFVMWVANADLMKKRKGAG